MIPALKQFQKKYYYLMTTLLFEYEESGYDRNDLEIVGFSEEEADVLCSIFSYFYQDDGAIKIEGFDYSIIELMISILPDDEKKLLIDHIVLSSINQSSDIETLVLNLQTNLLKVGESLPIEYFSELDFSEFFKGKESQFMDEYYPSEEEKDEIRVQYALKYKS